MGYYEAFDKLEELTLENILIHWLAEQGCIVIVAPQSQCGASFAANENMAICNSRNIDIYPTPLKLFIDGEKIYLKCRDASILETTIYDGDRFEEIKNIIEDCTKRPSMNRCKGCSFERRKD